MFSRAPDLTNTASDPANAFAQRTPHSTTRTARTNMDLHRTSILNQMDYSRGSKDGKAAQSTEDRLDSGVDSLKEEEFQAVAEEIHRLQLESEHQQAAALIEEPLQEWQTQTTDEGDT
ncbi:hypothetical protein GOODEAATRI_015333 [Goodea atripinnis]|uniref:Uncharacterized protein n=1 Tax=Goodea atripinnis TaxID=208336 RepID=A0ABV0MI51_9TELE